tara:strand:- start:886 stop:1086 length:201 start_codon:yes stop_codon:yes gene_type:complete
MRNVFPNASELLSRYSHYFKFEDFQKSEIFSNEIVEDGFIFRVFATLKNENIIILKEERIRQKTNE